MTTFAIAYFFFGFTACCFIQHRNDERRFGFLPFFTAVGWGFLWPLLCVVFLVFPPDDREGIELEEV